MDFPTTLQKISEIKNRYPRTGMILVEDKANGSAIIQMLRRRIPGIIPVNPEGGKVSRVNAISPAIEAGNVWLPKNASWVGDFVEQCASFPNGRNDDMVDAMSQAINRLGYFWAGAPSGNESTRDFFLYRDSSETEGELHDSYINMNIR
jgi:predicted phage terminase large subunit-like protein